ncbi:tRNA (adenosine(37)-N6)-threonylcarbamoyltransferase complex ATPase subunit type 1 TsaE [Mycoplasmopsis gallinarum]|uniref:tRNA threonylcarbamoyladenosine biosynthesis protein TsaE n=1 Tax=Mycoplasmopsis gallinarum TaxID=29557 RepID=A0A168RH31_9BACT|nr:tRNA (adenosine(37)-N6)-threonylcarbamoyltransferase complex ATPase subunit type 1 TsaE [Mycoplasmopsis gallinarum]OAB48979.1 ATPase YjeE family [Mycoplasmopsis gallinarum]
MMQKKEFVAYKISDLDEIANYIMSNLTNSKYLLFSGELGSGKTALIKEIAKKLNINEPITSPTFNYIKIYDGLVHMDAYNLNGDLSEFEDYFEDNVIAIEWAEKIQIYENNYIKINVKVGKNNERYYEIEIIDKKI